MFLIAKHQCSHLKGNSWDLGSLNISLHTPSDNNTNLSAKQDSIIKEILLVLGNLTQEIKWRVVKVFRQ